MSFVWCSDIWSFKICIFVTSLHCEEIRKQQQIQDMDLEVLCQDREEKGHLVTDVKRQQMLPGLRFLFFLTICINRLVVPASKSLGAFVPSPLCPSALLPVCGAMSSRPVPRPPLGCQSPHPTWGPTWVPHMCVTSTAVGASVMSVGLTVSLGDS